MTGSCPVSALVCQETARERDELAAEVVNLRNHVRALTEDVARTDTLATILDGAREGLARSGSRAKGVRDVQALLTASAVREGVQEARRRVLSTRRREDRGRAASNALGLLRERDAARAELERLRAGLKALAVSGARGIDLTPTTTGYVSPQWVYDYLATLDSAWRDRVRRLLDGECQEKPIKEGT